jgi:hypothetical protein
MRLLSALRLATALLGAASVILAQRAGGGHASSAGHGSFSTGSYSRTSSPLAHSIYPTVSVPVGGATGINPGALPTGPYRSGIYRSGPYRPVGGVYRGGRNGSAYYPYYPLFDDYDDYGYGSYNNGYQGGYPALDPAASQTASVTANMLGEQVERLSAEAEALRDQREQDYAAPMPRPRYNAPPMMQEDQTPTSAPLDLILRDGKQLKINSYAVMGQEIWDFSSQTVKKIPLANVDVAASRKATEAGGGEFPELR